MEKQQYNTEEVEKYYGISKPTQERYRKHKGMPYYKIDRLVYYKKKELDEWLDKFKNKDGTNDEK